MRTAAMIYWAGTIWLVVGASIELGLAGALIALGGALMIFSINALRSINR